MLIIIDSNVHLPHSNIFTEYLLCATEKGSSCPQVYGTLVRHTNTNIHVIFILMSSAKMWVIVRAYIKQEIRSFLSFSYIFSKTHTLYPLILWPIRERRQPSEQNLWEVFFLLYPK